ncbi:hypothetical protein BG011_003252 [Mortierella polycephala]|uniref:Protein kinase domain-containing protein n=1 Tax=Mortierella polycephala TaxID=41804 RepID=A0A9P6Q1E9_9FUNG|nr:hypothetical protein BG011_003252 [Mortierella polycephala]
MNANDNNANMHVLNVIETLHENPYTGDKISKACVYQFDPCILKQGNINGHDDREQEHSQELKQEQEQDRDRGLDAEKKYQEGSNSIVSIQSAEKVSATEEEKAASSSATTHIPACPPERLPNLVAIKFLSDYRVVRRSRPGRDTGNAGWSSGSEDSYDSSSEDEEDETRSDALDHTSDQQNVHRTKWPTFGQYRVPEGVKFGVKAKREIRALKAAQGHPNVIPFLGFIGKPVTNPFKPTKAKQDSVSQDIRKSSDVPLTGPLLGSTLGESLFPGGGQSSPHSPLITSQIPPRELFPPYRNSGFNSDFESEQSSSDEENEEAVDLQDASGVTLRHWNRVFSRQPRMGGMVLPYIPVTLKDLIRIGWTKTRPLLVETCMRQILEALSWIHEEAGLIHRDISATNILVAVSRVNQDDDQEHENPGRKGVVQCMISDFGCATFYSPEDAARNDNNDNAADNQAQENDIVEKNVDVDNGPLQEYDQSYQQGLTFEIGTRSYRAPELLFSSRTYTNAIDIWSAGVLFAEMYLGHTLFEADSDIGQVCAIVKVLGTPSDENWPEYKSLPDYGKLVFQARESNPLSNILLSGSLTGVTTEASKDTDAQQRDSIQHDNAQDSEHNSGHSLNVAPSTLISPKSFELIERMVVYSGTARPSARAALELKGWCKESEDDKQNQQRDKDEHMDQCIIDTDHILEEQKRLREQEEGDEEEEDGGISLGRRTFSYSPHWY